jgi:ABC-type multidrug transport system ATPase subunit
MQTLKRLAEDGRTVIASIHAPRSEIWSLFDRVVLLSRGSLLYAGPAAESLAHFAEHGHSIAPFVNPAEFLIDLAAYDSRSNESEMISRARIESLKRAWQQRSSEIDKAEKREPQTAPPEHVSTASAPKKVGFGRQFHVLTARTFKVTVRDPMGVMGSLFQAIGWLSAPHTQSQKRPTG